MLKGIAEPGVEIYPEEPTVDLRGSYRLVNRTDGPIDSVHVFLNPDIEARTISVERAAGSVLADDEVGYRIYALERPLEPGDSLALAFEVAYRPRGFPNDRLQTDVVANGTYFNRSWLPFIGYQPMFELTGAEARERFGLEPRPLLAGPEDGGALRYRDRWRGADLVRLEAIIGTAPDQIAITPGALRRYLERFRDGGPPYPTSLDLYAELRAVTPDSLHSLLTDLFETVTLWDVKAEQAVVEPTGTGEYVVTLDVVAKKMRADSVGDETKAPMDDLVEIGVFAPSEGDGPGEPLCLQRHRIRSGAQTIRITVPREPARAGIDPYRKLIDRQRHYNVVAVDAAGAGAVEPGS